MALRRLGALRAQLAAAPAAGQEQQVGVVAMGRNEDVAAQIRDECLPLAVDATGAALPAELEKLRARQRRAAAEGDFHAALLLQDLLFSVEPRRPLTLEECAPPTLEGKREFFLRNGFVVVPAVLQGEQLARVQGAWARAQAPSRALWEEAKAVGVLPEPLDGIYFENLNPYQRPYAPELERFSKLPHGRKFFDFPHVRFSASVRSIPSPADYHHHPTPSPRPRR